MRPTNKLLLVSLSTILFAVGSSKYATAQCTETNAAGCACPTPGATNCLLLPDILAGKHSLNSTTGWTEYTQTIGGVDKGLIRLDVATPNVGWGPLQTQPTNDYVCGSDTLHNFFPPANFLCPDGSYPKRLIKQVLYQKNGSTFQFILRDAGWMQFHPLHGHIHIDDWGHYTLRFKDPTITDTLKWPIVSNGIKVSFCLIDYTTCSGTLGDCVDANGNVLGNANFPNYGLAGGYSCGQQRQGISVGKVDIYHQYLDESFIKIPYEACNGGYYAMIQIDPLNHFLEMNENNNWLAAAVPLTKQRTSNTGPYSYIFSKRGNIICLGDSLELEASGASNYLWNTGATTQKMSAFIPGKYWVRATTPCGITTSDTLTVISAPASSMPAVTKADTVCVGDHANLYASGNAHWFDAAVGGNLVYIGNDFQTGSLLATTNFYVADQPSLLSGTLGAATNSLSATGNNTTGKSEYLIFNAFLPFKLKTVRVYANVAGNRLFQLRDMYGAVLAQTTRSLAAGMQDVQLDFFVPSGMNLQLGLGSSSPVTALYSNTTTAANIGYPFKVNSVARIVGSSLGDQLYPFFYNWQIEGTPQACNAGTRKLITAKVVTPVVPDILGLQSSYLHTQNGVTLTVSPAGGSLTADAGLVGFTFYPKLAGVGAHQLTYTFKNGNCINTITKNVNVGYDTVALTDGFSIQLWNNPGRNQRLYLVTTQNSAVDITLYNGTGQKLQQMAVNAVSGSNLFNLDFNNLSRGLYFIEVRMGVNGGKKLIKLLN